MSLVFECLSAGTPLCRVRVLANHSDSVRPACQKLLKPHSIGDVPEVKEIREGSSSINLRLEANPREAFSIRVFSHDRIFCELCQVPNDPVACEASPSTALSRPLLTVPAHDLACGKSRKVPIP
jgi:hypothetical protein